MSVGRSPEEGRGPTTIIVNFQNFSDRSKFRLMFCCCLCFIVFPLMARFVFLKRFFSKDFDRNDDQKSYWNKYPALKASAGKVFFPDNDFEESCWCELETILTTLCK